MMDWKGHLHLDKGSNFSVKFEPFQVKKKKSITKIPPRVSQIAHENALYKQSIEYATFGSRPLLMACGGCLCTKICPFPNGHFFTF